MTAYRAWAAGRIGALARAVAFAALALFALALPVEAQDKGQLLALNENGFGRLVLSFPDRLDLPRYRIRFDNGVLAVEFEQPIDLALPDVAVTLREYISIARLDPDGRGVRFGFRTGFNVNRLEAGERLFIDILPLDWQGLPPSLPEAVINELATRAKEAAILAEQKRKAEEAKTVRPVATLRVGRNPTFYRVQFDWSVTTEARYEVNEEKSIITFDWPVPIDLYALKADLPDELLGAANVVDENGSRVELRPGKGVVPRFYQLSKTAFVLDIDIDIEAGVAAAIAADEEVKRRQQELEGAMRLADEDSVSVDGGSRMAAVVPEIGARSITPVVSTIGNTVRVTFPFEQDTAAAVFRRADTVWMVFDTPVAIEPPPRSKELSAIAEGFEVFPAGATKVVRLDLARERLATLGSEGRAWVLSLGDVLLTATQPIATHRHRDDEGRIEMIADLARPSRIHEFRDPVVGDLLKVVTAFPPAQGTLRTFDYVDFDLLRSVHGLVVKPENEAIEIALEDQHALLSAPEGLKMAALDTARTLDSGNAPEFRGSYVDLSALREDDAGRFVGHREELINRAASTEGRQRDAARLELAQFYVGNRFAYEALGVLDVMESSLRAEDLRKKIRLTRGIASTLAVRPSEALVIFSSAAFADQVDALMWRSLAKTQVGDYAGARADAIAAEGVIDSYPAWVRTRFLLSAIRAALETNDIALALRYLDRVEFVALNPEQVTEYQLFQGWVAENEGRTDEAIDTYGQVIAADVRPTRAEAIYRTLLLLDRTGEIDLLKATETLSAEVMLWRGNALEARMQKLLAELYFRNKEYRLGFETVKQATAYYPDNRAINALLAKAQEVFTDLYLNGRADELDPVAALSLYYDFRQLTPPGQRGDEMIRNLARRLVKVDLLTQAGDLLEYQIDSRLKGVAQAQIAADLAIIRIADRDPEGALRVLNRTRLADLSPMLERRRRILEARALLDAGRQDLAIALLSSLQGHDADLLRVEGYWKSKNYGLAAELLETMYSPRLSAEEMTQPARMNVVKAAVGFALANDQLGMSRLRSKFGEAMAKSPEWPMFDFVTSNIGASSVEFRRVAREVSGLDSLNAFLESYRQAYAIGDGMTPERAVPANEA